MSDSLAIVGPDARRRALVRDASGWAAKQGLFSGQPAVAERACVNAATYASLCAPVHASDRQLELATTFTVIFFWLDDADPRELAALLDDPFARMPALSHWRADARELDACRPELATAWSKSLLVYLAALVDELAIDRRRVTVAQQLDLRRRNAFIDPYLDLWFALVDAAPLAVECARARWIGRELIIYANDLGSLDRDLVADRERPELNLAITMAREYGCTPDEAAHSLVEQHDALCGELRGLLPTIAAVAPAWVGVLREVVIGNVLAMRALAERYAGSTARLDALALPL